jgi:phosphonate transport system substrate-binding protein
MRRLLTPRVAFVVLALWAAPAAAEQPLQLGLLPSRSAAALMRDYAPLKRYLEFTLGREIIMSTAPDFREYQRRTLTGDYDLLHTAPHFARHAQQEKGFVPVVRTRDYVRGALLVPADAPYRAVTELRGLTVAAPDELAAVTMLGEQLLRGAGLEPHRDVRFHYSPSHTSAALAVVHGQAAAAVVFPPIYHAMSADERRVLRVLAETPKVPGTVYLAHPRLGAKTIAQLRRALLEFHRHAEAPKFFSASKLSGFEPVSEAEMQALDPYVTMLKRRLAPARP